MARRETRESLLDYEEGDYGQRWDGIWWLKTLAACSPDSMIVGASRSMKTGPSQSFRRSTSATADGTATSPEASSSHLIPERDLRIR